MCHARTALEILFEQLKRRLLGFRLHFDLSTWQIPRIPSDPKTLRRFEREITVTDTLNATTNEVVLRANHFPGEIVAFLIPSPGDCSGRRDVLDGVVA